MKHPLAPVADSAVTFRDPFRAPRRQVNRTVTLAREYELLRRTGRLEAFNPRVKDVHPCHVRRPGRESARAPRARRA
ncbi:MAG: hypothetical protein GX590_06110 [Lentisphaerae bacterium]|nr:hypothetical protein [Lentisphaerota bacterium]